MDPLHAQTEFEAGRLSEVAAEPSDISIEISLYA
jgi:hypothetical protein